MPRESQCGNPLLRDWVGEWMAEARAMQSKAYYTYKKAYDSLDSCQTTFAHPSEAEQLKGIGKGLCARLEARMIKHCKDHGLPIPARRKGKKRMESDQDTGTQDDAENSQTPKKKQRVKPYIPRYRSGPYGILLAMLDHLELNNQTQSTREQIIRIAADYCDASYDMPDPGKNYTAWHSIKTLLNKGYVWKQGNPTRYMLTESGIDLSKQLRKVTNRDPNSLRSLDNDASQTQASQQTQFSDDEQEPEISQSMPASSASEHLARTRQSSRQTNAASTSRIQDTQDDEDDQFIISPFTDHEHHSRQPSASQSAQYTSLHSDDDGNDDDIIMISSSPTRTNSQTLYLPSSDKNNESKYTSDFIYTYLNSAGKAVQYNFQAAVDLDCDYGLAYYIRFPKSQKSHPTVRHVTKLTEEDDVCKGYLFEMYAASACPGFNASTRLQENVQDYASFFEHDAFLDEPDFLEDDLTKQKPASPDNLLTNDLFDGDGLLQKDEAYCFSNDGLSVTPCSQTSDNGTLGDSIAFESQTSSQREDLAFPSGDYDIVLVLDSREIKMRNNREYFLEQLTSRGIRVVKRSLELGDVIWVAQKKGSTQQSDELFLDVIVERKRLDDLVSSIKDGRFEEQKYRLKHCGARKVIYVIEEYNKDAAVSFGLQAIQTVMSSVQVVDGFFLKRTASIDDTIDYLVLLTRMVEEMYKGETLYRIPEHTVNRQDFLTQKERLGGNHLVSYPLFSRLNSKSSMLLLEEVYLRMLLKIRGVSYEKAMSLVKVYPTPHALLEAYASTTNEREAKALAKNATKDGIARRRWGIQISERLWEVWAQLDYPVVESED